jgi:putative membrane protein
MISRFSDHAANERTYLAWVRTGIAVMAFGFLVEKFDLFLTVAARDLGSPASSGLNQAVGDGAGLLLLLLGGLMMVAATIRFRQIGRDIDASDTRPARGTRMDTALVGLLLTLGTTLFAFLAYTVVRRLG